MSLVPSVSESPLEKTEVASAPPSALYSSPVDSQTTNGNANVSIQNDNNGNSDPKVNSTLEVGDNSIVDGIKKNNTVNNAYVNGRGYGGYGAGGMMMDPYSMGGYGMNGMYGGGMLSPGMMMMGGGMYGMSPEAQRAQMMMFMMGRVMEIGGMLTQAFTSTCGSAIELLRSYDGITQSVDQMDSEYKEQCHNYLVHEKERIKALRDVPSDALKSMNTPVSHPSRLKTVNTKNSLSSFCFRALRIRVLRYCIFVVLFLLGTRMKSAILKT